MKIVFFISAKANIDYYSQLSTDKITDIDRRAETYQIGNQQLQIEGQAEQ